MSADARPPWWAAATFYVVYLRSFADDNGDGVGDLAGLAHRLPYIAALGVDAIWITPFYRSPMVDHGYDVADHRAVDALFGTLDDIDRVVSEAHLLGLRVITDIVPNHVSDQHPWFSAACAAAPGSPARDRFVFADGRPEDLPPNNWTSTFGGPAWTRVADGQWYLHLYTARQPDLNWRNEQVGADLEATLRFWLDRGIDGFRIDVAHGLYKDAELRDSPGAYVYGSGGLGAESRHVVDQDETHDVYRRWRALADSYGRDIVLLGEVYLADPERRARYVRSDELHLATDFDLMWSTWTAPSLRAAIDGALTATSGVGGRTSWMLSSLDTVRHRTRLASPGDDGERRARAAALLLLGLPGPVFLYQGEELGLDEVNVPTAYVQDPAVALSGGTAVSRDGCRVPMPWSGEASPFGFTTGSPWLPMPERWRGVTVARQQDDPGSMLQLYRAALRLRRLHHGAGAALTWLPSPPGALVFRVGTDGPDPLVVAVNLGDAPVDVPVGDVVLASERMDHGRLAPDAAVWVRPAVAAAAGALGD